MNLSKKIQGFTDNFSSEELIGFIREKRTMCLSTYGRKRIERKGLLFPRFELNKQFLCLCSIRESDSENRFIPKITNSKFPAKLLI